jgi:hypothetical protein
MKPQHVTDCRLLPTIVLPADEQINFLFKRDLTTPAADKWLKVTPASSIPWQCITAYQQASTAPEWPSAWTVVTQIRDDLVGGGTNTTWRVEELASKSRVLNNRLETVKHNAQDNLDSTAHPIFGHAAAGERGTCLKGIKGEIWPWGSCQAFIERS